MLVKVKVAPGVSRDDVVGQLGDALKKTRGHAAGGRESESGGDTVAGRSLRSRPEARHLAIKSEASSRCWLSSATA